MYIFNKVTVIPKLPNSIDRLGEIANNIWWSWNASFLALFKEIDEEVWNASNKNPIKFLKKISQDKLESAANDEAFMNKYEAILDEFDKYMSNENTYFNQNYPEYKNDVIAYFSAEYGLDETLPLYSGGLGVLSGDHMKVASDLDLPFVGIGLLYKEGYFNQIIDGGGNQRAEFVQNDIYNLPIHPVKTSNNKDLTIEVDIADETVKVKIWSISVGRVKLYLLDTDLNENSEKAREITKRLYGGDKEMRISQEIVLGIGGLRALKALDIKPTIYHMNEGHSAFLIFELVKKIMKNQNVDFNVAIEWAKARLIFTTHTAVPAGNDIFDVSLMEKYFYGLWDEFGITKSEFMGLGAPKNDVTRQSFNMGVFALKYSSKKNGVSKLHAEVTKELFSNVWPNIADHESPVEGITNGVHTLSWLAENMKKLYSKYLKTDWQENIQDELEWEDVDKIPNDELWYAHQNSKKRLLREIRTSVTNREKRNGKNIDEINSDLSQLKPDALTIGFARRFATYKRATMLFNDIERLTEILNDENRPVQIVFAGKAHPADKLGQDLIRRIHEVSQMPQFKGKIILLENYNMAISRFLISGTDVWLNTPRRPMEASGTSGQKAAINGVLNFSTLDGWWDEGYNGENGWAIGDRNEYSSDEEHDRFDANNLYNILENEIIPMYYEREDGIPNKWLEYMKNSIKSCTSEYSMARMLIDYLEIMYIPTIKNNKKNFQDKDQVIRYTEWVNALQTEWKKISIVQEQSVNNIKLSAGSKIKVKCLVNFAGINPKDADVEVYVVKIKENGQFEFVESIKMEDTGESVEGQKEFAQEFIIEDGGNFAYTFRVIPKHEMLLDREDLDLVKWFINENKIEKINENK